MLISFAAKTQTISSLDETAPEAVGNDLATFGAAVYRYSEAMPLVIVLFFLAWNTYISRTLLLMKLW